MRIRQGSVLPTTGHLFEAKFLGKGSRFYEDIHAPS